MLLGLTEPTSGKARVLGLDPTREPIKVKSKIGYLQENMGFYTDLNAVQMLRFVAELEWCFAAARPPAAFKDALEIRGLGKRDRKKNRRLFQGDAAASRAWPSC